jgi:putative SOS response-associated peptidase YedK
MPVILPEQEYDRWLDPQLDHPVQLQTLPKPYAAEEMVA